MGDINSDGKPDVVATAEGGDMKLIINETERLTAISDEELLPEKNYILYQNYPNPFNPVTKIKYTIPQTSNPLQGETRSGFVILKVYDILGNEITTLVNEVQSPGTYEVEFNVSSVGIGLSSGIYFYKISSGSFSNSKKMIFLK